MPVKNFWTPDMVERLIELVEAGATPREAAAVLRITKNAAVAKALRLGHPFNSRGLKERLSSPWHWTPQDMLPEPPPCTVHPPKPDHPHRCHVPGCKGVKQHNPRGLCAEHEAEHLNAKGRRRANMREVGVGTRSGAI
jgi:hypothetical protein